MIRTKFQAVTDHHDMKGRAFTRTSQSHNAAKPFTHVVLVQRHFDDNRGTCWFAESWAGSLALGQRAADHYRQYITIPPKSNIVAVELVPAVIVGTVGHETRCADCGQVGAFTGHQDCQYPRDH